MINKMFEKFKFINLKNSVLNVSIFIKNSHLGRYYKNCKCQ